MNMSNTNLDENLNPESESKNSKLSFRFTYQSLDNESDVIDFRTKKSSAVESLGTDCNLPNKTESSLEKSK